MSSHQIQVEISDEYDHHIDIDLNTDTDASVELLLEIPGSPPPPPNNTPAMNPQKDVPVHLAGDEPDLEPLTIGVTQRFHITGDAELDTDDEVTVFGDPADDPSLAPAPIPAMPSAPPCAATRTRVVSGNNMPDYGIFRPVAVSGGHPGLESAYCPPRVVGWDPQENVPYVVPSSGFQAYYAGQRALRHNAVAKANKQSDRRAIAYLIAGITAYTALVFGVFFLVMWILTEVEDQNSE